MVTKTETNDGQVFYYNDGSLVGISAQSAIHPSLHMVTFFEPDMMKDMITVYVKPENIQQFMERMCGK